MAFTAIIEKEDDWYVAKAAELEVTSQGKSVKEAIANLQDAIGLYLKHAEPEELAAIRQRQASLLITPIDVEPAGSAVRKNSPKPAAGC
ncbi:MAG: type II toxin-antitoxin system HicB family antitoxin [Candidatus Micrarchaeota archaeon]